MGGPLVMLYQIATMHLFEPHTNQLSRTWPGEVSAIKDVFLKSSVPLTRSLCSATSTRACDVPVSASA